MQLSQIKTTVECKTLRDLINALADLDSIERNERNVSIRSTALRNKFQRNQSKLPELKAIDLVSVRRYVHAVKQARRNPDVLPPHIPNIQLVY